MMKVPARIGSATITGCVSLRVVHASSVGRSGSCSEHSRRWFAFAFEFRRDRGLKTNPKPPCYFPLSLPGITMEWKLLWHEVGRANRWKSSSRQHQARSRPRTRTPGLPRSRPWPALAKRCSWPAPVSTSNSKPAAIRATPNNCARPSTRSKSNSRRESSRCPFTRLRRGSSPIAR